MNEMEMPKMSPEEMEEKKKMVLSMCTCENCPTWKDCHDSAKEKGFCFMTIGKSKCIKQEKGCICGSCPVYSKMGLKHGYYCTRDSEMAQNMKDRKEGM